MKLKVFAIGKMGKEHWFDAEEEFIIRDIKYNEHDAIKEMEDLNRVKHTYYFYKPMYMELTELDN